MRWRQWALHFAAVACTWIVVWLCMCWRWKHWKDSFSWSVNWSTQWTVRCDLIDIIDHKMRSQERLLATKDATITELELRITSVEQTSCMWRSYDSSSTLLWRITDFQHKRQDAISGRVTSISTITNLDCTITKQWHSPWYTAFSLQKDDLYNILNSGGWRCKQ